MLIRFSHLWLAVEEALALPLNYHAKTMLMRSTGWRKSI